MRNERVEGMLATMKEEDGPSGLLADIDRVTEQVDHLGQLVGGLARMLAPIMPDEMPADVATGRGLDQETEAQRKVDNVRHLVADVTRTVNRILDGVRL